MLLFSYYFFTNYNLMFFITLNSSFWICIIFHFLRIPFFAFLSYIFTRYLLLYSSHHCYNFTFYSIKNLQLSTLSFCINIIYPVNRPYKLYNSEYIVFLNYVNSSAILPFYSFDFCFLFSPILFLFIFLLFLSSYLLL